MFLYLIAMVALIGADQALKYWTVAHLTLGESAPLLPGVIQLTRLHNYGAAWSSLSGKTIFLVVVNILILLAVIYLLAKKIVRHPLGVWGCVLILSGGIGNMIDRLWHGYVVDMFHLQFMDFPIFNLADCFVVVGVILAAVYYLWFFEKHDNTKEEKKHGTDTPDGLK